MNFVEKWVAKNLCKIEIEAHFPQILGKTKFIEKKFPVESNILASRWLHSRILSKIQYWIGNFFAAYQFSEGRFVCVALKHILTLCLHSSLFDVRWNMENPIDWIGVLFDPCALHCTNSWDLRQEQKLEQLRNHWKKCWNISAVVAQRR